MNPFLGTGVALITPFNDKGDIDYEGLNNLLIHTSNVSYYVVQGTTGEAATTTENEKKEILKYIIQNNTNNLPIIYGIGGNNTQGVINTIKTTDFNGIDAVLSVSPYYNKPSQRGIIEHFKLIADNSPVPILLYNVPGRTASNMLPSTTIELSKHPNIIGIKEASGSVDQAKEIIERTPEEFLVISGDDLLTPTLMSYGAVGVISVLANAFPNEFSKMIKLSNNNEFDQANSELQKLSTINELMYEESNPVGIKEVLHQMNICKNNVRMPLLPATQILSEKIKKLL